MNSINYLNSIRNVALVTAFSVFVFSSANAYILPGSYSKFETQYVPENTLDDNLSSTSRWSAKGDGQWIKYDLGTLRSVDSLSMAFYRGDERTTTISVEALALLDDMNWETLLDHASNSENTLDFESFDLEDIQARFVRIIGRGNSFPNNDWTSLTEVEIFGY